MTMLLQTRVKPKVAVRFQKAARRRGLSPYAFLQQIVTEAASEEEAVSSSASLELSRADARLDVSKQGGIAGW